VERSLPRDLENSRKAAVITVQTVWLPMSSRPVSQQPSRKNPVMGFIEQTSSRSPSTLRGVPGRPPPLPLSSLSIAVSARGVADRLPIFADSHVFASDSCVPATRQSCIAEYRIGADQSAPAR